MMTDGEVVVAIAAIASPVISAGIFNKVLAAKIEALTVLIEVHVVSLQRQLDDLKKERD